MECLIQYCRYYKGEEECPESYNGTAFGNVWFYEKVWMNSETDRHEKGFNTTEKKLIDILRKQKASNSIYL